MKTSDYESKGVLIRIGINSGPIIAGVIGLKKFVYDIWGNTVNIAQDIESAGRSHQILISESTYELVKEQIDTIPNGEIVLDDGSRVNTWWVKV
jgi:class 3 adenylate cyclase